MIHPIGDHLIQSLSYRLTPGHLCCAKTDDIIGINFTKNFLGSGGAILISNDLTDVYHST